MPKFRVDIPFSAVFTTEVEAKTPEEAQDDAMYTLQKMLDRCSYDETITDDDITIEEVD